MRLLSREAELEVHTGRPGAPEGHVFRGRESFVAQFRQLAESFEGLYIEPEEFIYAGDRIVVLLRAGGHGRASRVGIETRRAHVWQIRRGEAVRLDVYNGKDEALRALGLLRD